MGIFQSKRFVWNEPWFFQQRIRTAKAWIFFLLFLVVAGGAVGAALSLAAPAGKPMPLLEVIGMSLGFPAAIWWMWDGADSRRQAILYEDSIIVGGDMGKYSDSTTYQLADMSRVMIVSPDVSKWPATALFFMYGGEEQAIGIDSKVSLNRLAQALYDAGVAVEMENWHPNQESEFEKSFTWQADPNQVTGTAKLEPLGEGAVSMMSAGGILAAIVRQCWAITLWLAITGLAIYYAYLNWANLGFVWMALLIMFCIGTMYLAGQYTDRIASAATSQGLVRMAEKQIAKRNGLQLNIENELVPVEIFEPDQFDKTIQKVHEMGFVQRDSAGNRILFEGKKARWTIPANSIKSLSLEEVQTGTPGQSATGTLNYYVVVHFQSDSGDQTYGFRYGDREFGDFNDIKRAEGGITVYEVFESMVDA